MSEKNTHNQPGTSKASDGTVIHTSTQAAEHKGGLPQLNVDDFAPQLVWLAITFGALYWILSRIALPRIAEVIEKRRDHIATDIDEAKRLGKQSETAEAAYKSDLANAKSKAHLIAQETREKLNIKTDRKQAEVDKQINAQLVESEHRITAAKKSALEEVNQIASDTTKEIVNHLIGQKVSPDELADALKTISSH